MIYTAIIIYNTHGLDHVMIEELLYKFTTVYILCIKCMEKLQCHNNNDDDDSGLLLCTCTDVIMRAYL